MSNKFTRNITNIKNVNEQGLETNNQNDLLSQTDGSVFVRTLDLYHNLTDNIKSINGNIVTMNDGNKLNLPISLGGVYKEKDGTKTITYSYEGDVASVYSLCIEDICVNGVYSEKENVTTYVVTLTDPVDEINLVTKEQGKTTIVATLDTPYKYVTDYNITDKDSINFLKGRELIATKKELSDVKALLPKSIIKNVNLFPLVDMGSVMVNFDSYSIQDLTDLQVRLIFRDLSNNETELSKTKFDLGKGYDSINVDMANHLIPEENKNDMYHLYIVEVKHGTDFLAQTTIELRNPNHQLTSR